MGQTQSDEEEATPQLGDIIEFPRLFFKHYGVAVDKEHVVHLTSADNRGSSHNSSAPGPKAEVKMENISDVAQKRKYRINKKYDKDYVPRSREEIFRDAMAKVGLKQNYNLIKSNCEHFATSMRYGVPESKQVDGGIVVGSTLGAVALGAVAVIGGVLLYKAGDQRLPAHKR